MNRLSLFLLFVLSCARHSPQDAGAVLDAGEPDSGRFANADCSRAFAASDLNLIAASAIEEFMTSAEHSPCPSVGCDARVALPWCGPFGRVDGGIDWVGGLLASEDLSVIKVSAWRGQLYFAAPHVADPRLVDLRRFVAHVIVPDRVGPFQTLAYGLGMVSDGGVAEPPIRCFTEIADTSLEVRIAADWRYYWRPITYDGWAYCGPVGIE